MIFKNSKKYVLLACQILNINKPYDKKAYKYYDISVDSQDTDGCFGKYILVYNYINYI